MKTVVFLVLLFVSFVISQELDNTKRIIDGKNATWVNHTYLAKNRCDYGDGKGPVLCGCTSTLVGDTKRYAITASHCVNRTGNPKLYLEFYNGQRILVTDYKVYPGATYDTSLKTIIGLTFTRNDIAIQKLHSKPTGSKIKTLPLNYVPKNLKGKEAQMRGWGITTNDLFTAEFCFEYPALCYPENEAETLQEVTEKISTVADFNKILAPIVPSTVYTVYSGLTCATPVGLTLPNSLTAPLLSKKGPCVGDSGSPLIYTDFFKKSVIVGLFTDTFSFGLTPDTVVPCGNGFDLFTTLTDDIVTWIFFNTLF